MSNKERFSEAFRFQLNNQENNELVSNCDRFSEPFCFQLTDAALDDLWSQTVILNEIDDVKPSATLPSNVADKMQGLL